MSLGECYKCHGPLCIRSGLNPTVACERCGQPQPDHPKTKEMQDAKKAEVAPKPVEISHEAFHNFELTKMAPGSKLDERVKRLEEQSDKQHALLTQLLAEMQQLKKLGKSRQPA